MLKFCPNCGSKLEGKHFCTNCGHQISVPPSPELFEDIFGAASTAPPKQWSATVGPNGLTQCPQCSKTLRIRWTGTPGSFVCPVGAGGCGITFTVTLDPTWSRPTPGGGQASAQTQSRQSQPAPPFTNFVLACPKCQRAIGLPPSTYGITQCICGFQLQFRTEEKVGRLAPQSQYDGLSRIQVPSVSLETTLVNMDGSVCVDCPQCGAKTLVVAPGYPSDKGTHATCKNCGNSFGFHLAQSPGAIRSASPFLMGVPLRPFKPLPLTSGIIIYCRNCSNQILRNDFPPGSTFDNRDAPQAYDNRVLPTVGMVWTKCKACLESEVQRERDRKTEDAAGSVRTGCKVFIGFGVLLLGIGQLPFFPFGTFFGILTILWGISLIADRN